MFKAYILQHCLFSVLDISKKLFPTSYISIGATIEVNLGNKPFLYGKFLSF